ncbi:hypothetical protein SASPL_134324 [Salvia splendens]|uniref:malate dehydrogenase n=1 Tax=Salvia splendens TaxID=180675 RepID=A0A8X8X6P2_SALSN|nr:hypothetical protein SASPL_134324 [Salvia splendens]
MIRKDLSISPSSYSSIVRLICRDGKFSLALSLTSSNLHPELVLYNILIFHISSRQKTLDTVIGALQNKGLHFDDVTFNFVIRGLLLHKDVSHALHYLTTMIRKDLKPTNRTLRGVISSLCHEGELEPALNLSREMELRVGFLDRMALKGLIPNHIKYDSLIKQFSQHGRVDKAVNLLNAMLQKGSHPEATSYDCLIQGFCNGQKLDVALDFHKEMLCRDLKPSMTTWDTLIRALSAGGRVVEAEDLLKSMIQFGETPQREAFNCVIYRYRSEKNISKTSELLKVMQQKGYEPDFDTHWSLIRNLSHSTKKDGGSFLLNLLSGFSSEGKNNPRTVHEFSFMAQVLGLDPREVSVPVVGGHAGVTILPLLSQVKPPCSLTPEETKFLTKQIQDGGTEVVQAKAGAGSATLSMAYAAVKFADACFRGLRGDAGVECAFVASQATDLLFIATKVRLGRGGAEKVYHLGPLNGYESKRTCKVKETTIHAYKIHEGSKTANSYKAIPAMVGIIQYNKYEHEQDGKADP